MKVKCDNQELELPTGSSAKELAEKMNLREPHQALAVSINGKQLDLDAQLSDGDDVKLLDFESQEGKEVFWHTSAHVLAQAVLRIWPKAVPTIGPPIENGFYYDFANLDVSEGDFPRIEKEIKKILGENFKPERHEFLGKKEALKEFGDNPYKKELIEGFEEGSLMTAYKQGEFFDLCRGPHLPSLGKIKAFKLLKTSGAYWRGDSKNTMLTRIYGISFPSREELKAYIKMLEEAKKRDHRVLGAKLDLFSFKEEAPAMPFFHNRGVAVWDHLVNYWKELHLRNGYETIKTPQLMTRELWELSGHWEHYKENMFTVELDDERSYAIKPMNCPGCMLYFKGRSHSYRELPLRIAEFGHVHRREPSGALNGLFRVQSFHQDDAHIFMQPSQIKDEILGVLHLVKEIYETFGLRYTFELSTRPEKAMGSDEDWKVTTAGLQEALDEWGSNYKINEGDGAFYGPKIDLHVHDAIGRRWQCGTIQLDMSLPEKFKLEYKDSDGEYKRPIMIHRAIFGSIERFLGILIEHFAGKFPFWMSPLPVRVIPVAEAHADYARDVARQIRKAGFLCDCDESPESLGKRVRNAQLLKINYMLTVGDKEVQNKSIALRTRDNVVHGEIKLEDFLKNCTIEYKERKLTSPYQEG
ncbi:threonine--tRNA ligase [Candidatus Neptunichlamydia sp. REUL1]|uniref:threonine--tRNA ligase n=1 Tax=Candidatus Neptunichlamydia sp. REUL1 TaxID=3064277 RepID=UPI00292E562B|nr:threonine--tRNA ligase [Candidatus Neptunochlamydia sp. REUL1]